MPKENKMIQVAVIDDESAFLKTMEILIGKFSELEICGTARGVETGIKLIEEEKPDIVFLDVEMEDGTGFDILHRISNFDFIVIFVTAFDQYAIEAFKFSAIDYLLKPVISSDFIRAINKAKSTIELKKSSKELNVLLENILETSKQKRKIVLKELDIHHIIEVDHILWCHAEGSYTRFFLSTGQSIFVSGNLKEFESMLSNTQFFRVHRSHLVNLNKVVKFEKSDGATLYLQGGYSVPVSVCKKEKLAFQLTTL